MSDDVFKKPSFQPLQVLLQSMQGKEELKNLQDSRFALEDEAFLKTLPVLAFVGASGTGKSTRALELAKKYQVEYLIDDGLLISHGRILAGISAKKAKTKLDSVRQAVFDEAGRAENMRRALSFHKPSSLMILGTSDRMLAKICQNLNLSLPIKTVYIEEITSAEERKEAKWIRQVEGQHTIPVPTMEVKYEFNGYFLNALKDFRKGKHFAPSLLLQGMSEAEKTVVRPSYSSLGKYSISDEALRSLLMIILKKQEGVVELLYFSLEKERIGVKFYLELSLYYGYPAQALMKDIQKNVVQKIEEYTSINVLEVHIKAKKLIKAP